MDADWAVQSPEDRAERLQSEALFRLTQSRYFDDFYDILLMVEDTCVKANSLILKLRSPYFQAMLSPQYGFKESRLGKGSPIKIEGVPMHLFKCIMSYIYSDRF